MTEPSHRPDPDIDEHDEEQDDAIIGTVFRRSLYVLGAIAVFAAAGWLWSTRETPTAPVEEAAAPDLGALLDTAGDPEPPTLPFVDMTAAAGIGFVHTNGAAGDRLLPETMGGGVATFDYDRDGDVDVLFVDSGPWPGQPAYDAWRGAMRLFRNEGGWRFVDATRTAGLENVRAYGMGIAVGDADGDGWSDVLLTAVGANRFFRNERGVFHDATDVSGLAGADDAWSSSAGFFDADRDGDLDLFVVNYVAWSRDLDFDVDYRLDGIGRAYGPPTNFPGTQSYFYRNRGDGRFDEVGAEAGIHVSQPDGAPIGKGLALLTEDLDDDGWIDVMVANDTVRNFVFRNRGGEGFEEVGEGWGLAYDRNGMATGAMGIDRAEPYADGRAAIAIGNFANEMTSLYLRQGHAQQFADESMVSGVGPASRRALSFGLLFADFDLDGRLDLVQANGHVEDEIHRVQASQQFEQPAQVFWQCGEACRRRFVAVPEDRLGDLALPSVGRGLASADFDGDGDVDLVLTQTGAAPRLLRNDSNSDAHWIALRLEADGSVDRALGARVSVRSGEMTQIRHVQRTRSYLSQVEPVLHVGLGDRAAVDRVDITWPDGTTQTLGPLAVDRLHTIERDADSG